MRLDNYVNESLLDPLKSIRAVMNMPWKSVRKQVEIGIKHMKKEGSEREVVKILNDRYKLQLKSLDDLLAFNLAESTQLHESISLLKILKAVGASVSLTTISGVVGAIISAMGTSPTGATFLPLVAMTIVGAVMSTRYWTDLIQDA